MRQLEDREVIRASRIGLIAADPSAWEVECDGCDVRATNGIALLALATDLHFCRECLLRIRLLVEDSLEAVA